MERTAEFELTPEELWEVIAGPDGLACWLGDEVDLDVEPGASGRIVDEGEVREVEVDDVEPGRRLAFRWWPERHEDEASEVEILVLPVPHGSRLVISERPAVATGWQARLAA